MSGTIGIVECHTLEDRSHPLGRLGHQRGVGRDRDRAARSTFRAPSSLPISAAASIGGALAADDDLAGGVAIGDAEDAVRRGPLDELRQPGVVEADDRGHRAVAALARRLHEPAALADEAEAVGEGDHLAATNAEYWPIEWPAANAGGSTPAASHASRSASR